MTFPVHFLHLKVGFSETTFMHPVVAGITGFRATLENLEKVPILRQLRENLENSGKKIENWNDSGKTQGIFFLALHTRVLIFYEVY